MPLSYLTLNTEQEEKKGDMQSLALKPWQPTSEGLPTNVKNSTSDLPSIVNKNQRDPALQKSKTGLNYDSKFRSSAININVEKHSLLIGSADPIREEDESKGLFSRPTT